MQAGIKGKVIIITGGSSGIGAAAARNLQQAGAEVIVTGRSAETKRLAEEIGCKYYLVDYARLSDVKRFAEELIQSHQHIDILVNNVGGIIGQRRITKDGHEMTFQVNHLSGFLLTKLLQQRLEESNGMVINTSSLANTFGNIDFSDLENQKNYNAMKVYGTAKLMNILHAMEINRRFKNVRAVSFHPGTVSTGFAREGSGLVRWMYETSLGKLFLISPDKGADTLLWLISGHPGKDWVEGEYYYKRRPGRKNKQSTLQNAERLWNASEEMLLLSPY